MLRFFVLIVFLSALAVMAKAQVSDDKKQISMPDSIKSPANDFDEWLRNEPLKPQQHDSSILQPIPPQMNRLSPQVNIVQHPPIKIPIMTPKLRQDMILCYYGHKLEEQQKQNKLEGGGRVRSDKPPTPAALRISTLDPSRKTRQTRHR